MTGHAYRGLFVAEGPPTHHSPMSSSDLIVVRRDADNAGAPARRSEIESAMATTGISKYLVPVIPVRMTEAWLLLDESAIRTVAGNPAGRAALTLPDAANVTGRRRERLDRRFSENRRQLLERLDPHGLVGRLTSWCDLVGSVESVIDSWQRTPS